MDPGVEFGGRGVGRTFPAGEEKPRFHLVVLQGRPGATPEALGGSRR